MTAGHIATLINAGIGVLIGVYVSLLGHRVIGKKPGVSPEYDKWHKDHGSLLRVLGPVIAVCSALVALADLANRARD